MPLNNNRRRRDDALARIDATRFEALVAEHYCAEGWQVEHHGAAANGQQYDGGIDLKLRRGGEYIVVQCKRWTAKQVPHNPVHELIGVMTTESAGGAVLVTCGEFTRAALDAARREPRVQLVDGETIRTWIDVEALEAEARASSTRPEAGDGWAHAMARTSRRRSREHAREGIGTRAPAIIATIVAAAFIGFALLPSRATVNASADKVQPSAPRPTPASPPQRMNTITPATAAAAAATATAAATPERVVRLGPITEPIRNAATGLLRHAGRMPDPYRPIDREAARQATRKLDGVRSAFWIDRENLMVMVDGSERRSMATIDQVCIALQPLGDTLAVIVNLQDISAQNPDAATTLSRNCQLPEGQRAFGQRKRQVDVVGAETRAVFKDQQVAK